MKESGTQRFTWDHLSQPKLFSVIKYVKKCNSYQIECFSEAMVLHRAGVPTMARGPNPAREAILSIMNK